MPKRLIEIGQILEISISADAEICRALRNFWQLSNEKNPYLTGIFNLKQ
ncbi:hypothetical protein [Methylobacter sp.]